MDRLEHYLDQVCRSIGGPRSLRQHVRQELREHLRDAVAGYRAAGLDEDAAVGRALEDFGGPEQVRSELEATHGHRLLPVVIDKAMQWKETTMRAKWLWTTWAYLALASVLAVAVLWITFANVFLVPKFQKLTHDGMLDAAIFEEQGVGWMPGYLNRVQSWGDHATLWFILAVGAWGFFEWSVRSENKSFMRLAALGTAALGLLMVGVVMSGSLVIPFMLGMPALGKMTKPFAAEQFATIDSAVAMLEQAAGKQDWDAARQQVDRATQAAEKLRGPAVTSLVARQGPSADDIRTQMQSAKEALAEAGQAVRDKDVGRLESALQKFRQNFTPLREASRKPVS